MICKHAKIYKTLAEAEAAASQIKTRKTMRATTCPYCGAYLVRRDRRAKVDLSWGPFID